MRNYEVTFIVDPVLSSDEIKATAQVYADMIAKEGYQMVHIDEMGLRSLAYPINKRSSGVYFCHEFQGDDGSIIDKLELALKRDERIMRFLTIALDKFGVKYNDDKRVGKIGVSKKRSKPITTLEPLSAPAPFVVERPAPKEAIASTEAVVPAEAVVAPAPVAEAVEEVVVAAPAVEAVVEQVVEAPVMEAAAEPVVEAPIESAPVIEAVEDAATEVTKEEE